MAVGAHQRCHRACAAEHAKQLPVTIDEIASTHVHGCALPRVPANAVGLVTHLRERQRVHHIANAAV